jgi:hypothetical protein
VGENPDKIVDDYKASLVAEYGASEEDQKAGLKKVCTNNASRAAAHDIPPNVTSRGQVKTLISLEKCGSSVLSQ